MTSWSASESLVERCIDRQLEKTPRWLEHEVGDRRLRSAVERQVRNDLTKVANAEFARDFRRACPHPRAELEDYAFKLLPIGVTQWLVTSLRFLGRDVTWPFVQIDHSTVSIVDRNGWEIVEKALAEAYGHLSPRAIRVYDESDAQLVELSRRAVRCDLRYFAATVGQLRKVELPACQVTARLERVRDVSEDWFARYAAIYEGMRARSAIHRPSAVWHESLEDLRAAARDGLVAAVWVDGEWSGLFAYRPATDLCFDGWCVLEAALVPEVRGRGLAAHVHGAMVDLLETADDDVLFGTVMEGNDASARAAMRAGRRTSGAYWLVDLT
jgi:hypothetical protein